MLLLVEFCPHVTELRPWQVSVQAAAVQDIAPWVQQGMTPQQQESVAVMFSFASITGLCLAPAALEQTFGFWRAS